MNRRRQALVVRAGVAIHDYQRSTDAYDDVVAERLGINRTDLRCLDWLFDGPKAVGELTRAIGLSAAATTALLDRLEHRGFLRRVRDPGDRRKVLVEMTEQGSLRTIAYYQPLAAQGERLLARYSDAELERLCDLLAGMTRLTDEQRDRVRDKV
jgi:DNA-binding MarR family transcriptional regulator